MGNFLFKCALLAICVLVVIIALPIVLFSVLILVVGMFTVMFL